MFLSQFAHLISGVGAMSIIYEQYWCTRCIFCFCLWDEGIPKPLGTQEVIGPAVLRHANTESGSPSDFE